MKLLLLGSLLFSGGSAVAMQNETVNNEVSQAYNRIRVMVRTGFKGSMVERVKENGFPYPSEQQCEHLTDEQEAILMTTIDQINAEYDWANMTDEEIELALQEIKVELDALREELGIYAPQMQQRSHHGRHWNEDFVPNGDGERGYDGDCPMDDDEVIDPDVDAA